PVTITVHQSEKHPHHHAGMHTPGTHHTSSAHHAGTHHTSSTHHAGAHRSPTPVVLLLLLQHLWLLLHHRPLLGTRSDSATRQNESRREHKNVLLHFKSPQKHTPSHYLRTSDMDPPATAPPTAPRKHPVPR